MKTTSDKHAAVTAAATGDGLRALGLRRMGMGPIVEWNEDGSCVRPGLLQLTLARRRRSIGGSLARCCCCAPSSRAAPAGEPVALFPPQFSSHRSRKARRAIARSQGKAGTQAAEPAPARPGCPPPLVRVGSPCLGARSVSARSEVWDRLPRLRPPTPALALAQASRRRVLGRQSLADGTRS
jgi:hypothetical protein